jgi:FkbM family methyltransferase
VSAVPPAERDAADIHLLPGHDGQGCMAPSISYAQYYEDMHLARCFGEQAAGFYIDVGAGHPVHSNVSFLFYLRGWSGITVEPNPWLTQLSAAVRPRDRRIDSLLGAAPGQAIYHLVDHFHGLSTTLESHAQAVHKRYGKAAKAFPMPVTTLKAVCRRHAPAQIDFLKIDVEGAEQAVLEGNDWARFRPKVIVAEAVTPITMKPAWDGWEPILLANGYRFVFFDKLNRYYVDEDQPAIRALLARKPLLLKRVKQMHTFGRAADDPKHPDHRLAKLFGGADMVRLPLLGRRTHVKLLTAGLPAAELDRAARPTDAAAISQRLFGQVPSRDKPTLRRNATIADLYEFFVSTEQFQAACGRISASSAW